MSSIAGITDLYNNYNSVYGMNTNQTMQTQAADALTDSLQSESLKDATDEELMEVCKSFESYFVEQVMKEVKKTTWTEEEENSYVQYFGDTLVQEYAKMLTDQGSIGLAKDLYESMKRTI